MKNLFCYDQKIVDINKMRHEAEYAAAGDSREPPQDVVIHMHKYGVPCLGQQHEEFPAANPVVIISEN